MDENMAKVIFQPSGRRGLVPKGVSVIEASRLLGADIEALCGEKRACGKCKVRIEEGFFEKYGIDSKRTHVSPWQQEEEEKFINAADREAGFRLGCVTRIEGDLLVLYTDGVTEAMNTKNQQFGRERLETLVRQAEQMPVKEVIQKIRLSLEEFSEGKPLDDDTTIVVSRIA